MKKKDFFRIFEHIRNLISGSKFEGKTYVVGGAVRDLVMGNDINDIDLVVELPNGGIELSRWLEEKNETMGGIVIYPTYGTSKFIMPEFPCVTIECVQTRKEQYKDKNSRNPETEYGTIYEDAMRRDLTINALYYDITNNKYVDPTGKGFQDIKDCCIRVTSTPDIVFNDDPLRMLRTIRFFTRFHSENREWHFDTDTFKALYDKVDRLSIISKERIRDEFSKILWYDESPMAIRLLADTEMMKYIIPELMDTIELQQNKYHVGDVWTHTMDVFEKVVQRPYFGFSDLELRLAALLHDIGKTRTKTVDDKGNVHFYSHENVSAQMADTILKNLKYPNVTIEIVKFLVKNHMRTKQWGDDCSRMKDKALRKLQYECGYGRFCQLLTLIDADNNTHALGFCLPSQVSNIDKRSNEMVDKGEDMFDYELPINGDDVMEVKNLKPSRDVKCYLEYAMKLAFSKPKITRDELLKSIKTYKLPKNHL